MPKGRLVTKEAKSWLNQRLRSERWLALLLIAGSLQAQVCKDPADMAASTQSTLETAARRFFDMSARGDTAALKLNAIPAVAASFGGIEDAVKTNQAALAGGKATVRPPYLLTVEGAEPLERAEFLCGVFGATGQTKDSAVFVLNNLPPGQFAVTILDLTGERDSKTVTFILQQAGADWKLAGFYVRASQSAGHDAAWFTQRARDFKSKGDIRDAWLYYSEAIVLSAPVGFMSTQATDKLYDESQSIKPADLPTDGKVVDIGSGGETFHMTDIFALGVDGDLDVVVKYKADDVSDSARTFQKNTAVIKAVVARFPEFRQAFTGVVARAVEPSGRDYGTMVLLKDLK